MIKPFWNILFKTLVVILTVSGFLWFILNNMVYEYPKVRKTEFWYFIVIFTTIVATAIILALP